MENSPTGRFLHLGLVRQINPYKTRSLINSKQLGGQFLKAKRDTNQVLHLSLSVTVFHLSAVSAQLSKLNVKTCV
jgi:hypothetical protein